MGYLTIIITYITVEGRTVICQIIPVNRLRLYRTNGCNRYVIDEYTGDLCCGPQSVIVLDLESNPVETGGKTGGTE
jgi:hypothetical protein